MSSLKSGMNTSTVEIRPLARQIILSDLEIIVELADGRKITVPLAWFPRLLNASQKQRENWELLGDGEGIHWPDLDEDLSVAGFLAGFAARSRITS